MRKWLPLFLLLFVYFTQVNGDQNSSANLTKSISAVTTNITSDTIKVELKKRKIRYKQHTNQNRINKVTAKPTVVPETFLKKAGSYSSIVQKNKDRNTIAKSTQLQKDIESLTQVILELQSLPNPTEVEKLRLKKAQERLLELNKSNLKHKAND